VVIDHLKKWHRPGLLCIGDAAHAMSPIGGVGINLAIQDAVAAANILAPAFQRDTTPGTIPVMDALSEAISPAEGALPAAIAMGLTPALEGVPSAHINPLLARSACVPSRGTNLSSAFLRSRFDASDASVQGHAGNAPTPSIITASNSQEPAYSSVTEDDLAAVQRRREFPTRMMQRIQVAIQNRVISRVLSANKQIEVPLVVKLLRRFPILRRIPAYIVGVGFRPEHVETQDATAQKK
jgi:hypothetical protein